jgi:hypothetical protein
VETKDDGLKFFLLSMTDLIPTYIEVNALNSVGLAGSSAAGEGVNDHG